SRRRGLEQADCVQGEGLVLLSLAERLNGIGRQPAQLELGEARRVRATTTCHLIESARMQARLIEIIETSRRVQKFHNPDAHRIIDLDTTPAKQSIGGPGRVVWERSIS